MGRREPFERLTRGELRVLRCVAAPMSTREIAIHLELSEKTVENRRCRIVQKLGLAGTGALARFAWTYRDLLRAPPDGSAELELFANVFAREGVLPEGRRARGQHRHR